MIRFAIKQSKLSKSIPEHPRASWITPNLDALAQLFTVLWQKEFYQVKHAFIVLHHKIYFAIKQSNVETEHLRASSNILTDHKFACFSSTFDRFMAKWFLWCRKQCFIVFSSKNHFALKQSKIELNDPTASKSILSNPKFGCSRSIFDCFMTKIFYKVKTNNSLVFTS